MSDSISPAPTGRELFSNDVRSHPSSASSPAGHRTVPDRLAKTRALQLWSAPMAGQASASAALIEIWLPATPAPVLSH